MSMVKHWNSLPRDVVESPLLERVKNPTEQCSEQPALADCFEQGVGLDISSSPLQPQLLCDPMKTSVRKQQNSNRNRVRYYVFF